MKGYLEWVELAADFTVRSLKEWQWSTNSIHYLLALWGRLVAAVPYVRADAGAKSHTETLQVTESKRAKLRKISPPLLWNGFPARLDYCRAAQEIRRGLCRAWSGGIGNRQSRR